MPVCDSSALATGTHTVEWVESDWDKETGEVSHVEGEVWFTAQAFHCPVCGMRLDSEAEIDAAGIKTAWEIEGADWRNYEPGYDQDAPCEHWDDDTDEWFCLRELGSGPNFVMRLALPLLAAGRVP